MSKIDIAVVDYGMGNLRSVSKALEHVAEGQSVVVTSDPEVISQAARVVFPGQGAMPDCIRELDAKGLRTAVIEAAHTKPFLGICIGLQMLFEHSEEGDVAGLGILKGNVRRFLPAEMHDSEGNKLKVPHMAGIRSINILLANILCGTVLKMVHVSIMYIAIMLNRKMRRWNLAIANILSILRVLLPITTSLQYSFILKKVQQLA